MIICSLEIDNYKQYAGHHLIDFPEQGIVSVTGPNGAGKTTLFEAIEWALYNPNAIPLATIPPHDGVGHTTVRVTLEDPVDGVRYVVQRELRRRTTQAEIYREDNPSEPIVQGTKDVTRYVTRHLIGLPHDAFVSTFFTRQKELHFFGDRSETKRRTEVARLLGLEAVRAAQTLIGEERAAARSEAASRRTEHESRVGSRDLPAEEAVAANAVAAARAQEEAAEQASLVAEQAALAARQEFESWRELQLQASDLERQITAVSGQMSVAAAARDAASKDLERLELRAAERMEHAAVAGRIPELVAAMQAHEHERERAQLLASIEERRNGASARSAGIVARLSALVQEHPAAACDPRWAWSGEDQASPLVATARLQEVVKERDPRASRARVAALQEVMRLGDLQAREEATLEKFRRLLVQLQAQRAQIMADGGPDAAASAAQQVIDAGRAQERAAREAIAAAQVARKEAERVIAELEAHAGDAACPVCARELAPGAAERLIAERRADVAHFGAAEKAAAQQATAALRAIAAGEAAQQQARTQREALVETDSRLQNGAEKIEGAEASLQETSHQRTKAEKAARATYPVAQDDFVAAQAAAEQEERLSSLAGLLAQFSRDLGEARETFDRAQAEAAALGDVRYDATAHRQANDDLTAARRAATLIERIDDDLAHRPEYEQRLAAADAELAALSGQRTDLQGVQAGLGFDIARLQAAQAQEHAARAAEQQARGERIQARQAVSEAESALKRLRDEHDRLTELLELADRKTREADELSRMYDEFGEFDRYVARHVGPMLAETTERLLAQVTNSKYSQVRFDENYGIHVFDGDEDFPLSSFSGGERDVVALCARLALSEIVGSAAARPPRFLVLDEVFASLDVERREQLLETLGVLANGGHFRQMFIISHVEDVQQSPVMNEAWTIIERDGSSH
ncbi:MAG: SMC family ATPase, partial [Chloroflexota bacterium]|nr:SMC family ATPase [Chloroflexota bacterium]